MNKLVLITGGAGFVGSHLADELVKQGYSVRVLDNLCRRAHGKTQEKPAHLPSDVQFMLGDVRDRATVKQALEDVDIVYHLASRVGDDQSMYEIQEYSDVNNVGTSILLEEIIYRQKPLHRLVLASCMSVYGEGLYYDGAVYIQHASRRSEDLEAGLWDPVRQGVLLTSCPTPETKTPEQSSIYALSKYNQEKLCLMTGQAYHIPVTVLRLFHVYGTRMTHGDTRFLPMIAQRYLDDKPPIIYEDGGQKRDFVHVKDVVKAFRLAAEVDEAAGEIFNVGSGRPYSVRSVAEIMGRALKKEYLPPRISFRYRQDDIRHCYADISKAKSILGYEPEVMLDEGIQEFAAWMETQLPENNEVSTAVHPTVTSTGLEGTAGLQQLTDCFQTQRFIIGI